MDIHRRPREDSLALAQIVDSLRNEVVAATRELLADGQQPTADAITTAVLAAHEDEDLLAFEDEEPADSRLEELIYALASDLIRQRGKRSTRRE